MRLHLETCVLHGEWSEDTCARERARLTALWNAETKAEG